MEMNVKQVAFQCDKIITEVERAIIGKTDLIKKIIVAILGGGHILLEDYPGLGKTILSKSLATALGLDFKRIQFTPDLLPSDITGSYIYNRTNSQFELRKGPLFANIILADEINRASPKTQSALLESMQEAQITLEGETMPLNQPFIVVATQNPIEYEGTFPLPEAQLDRFIVKLKVGYPSPIHEHEILTRRMERAKDEVEIRQITDGENLNQMREVVESIHIEEDLKRYIVALVNNTRNDKRIAVGASPRGSLALLKLARANAALDGRSFVIPDDITEYYQPALVHRLILEPEFWMKQRAVEDILESLRHNVPVPVIE